MGDWFRESVHVAHLIPGPRFVVEHTVGLELQIIAHSHLSSAKQPLKFLLILGIGFANNIVYAFRLRFQFLKALLKAFRICVTITYGLAAAQQHKVHDVIGIVMVKVRTHSFVGDLYIVFRDCLWC